MKSVLKYGLVIGLLIAALSVFLIVRDSIRSDTAAINPDSYPMIGDEELGQLRWVMKIADQPLDDFTNLDAIDQKGMTAYRYSIAFMTYFLAVEQYHKLSACPALLQTRMDRFIQKIIEKPVWEYWADTSKGVRPLEPKLNKPYPVEHDPVGNRNIMYSGHLGHMIALYEMLYRDMKWSKPGSIVFAWSDDEKVTYDNNSLQKIMHDQMMNNADHCIECEPNACFPECNQHPILGFMLYDHVHGTDLAKAGELFFEFFQKNKLIDPDTHNTAALYLVKQKKTVSQSSPGLGNAMSAVTVPAVAMHCVRVASSSANGWTGTFMHAWKKEYIEQHYPEQRDDNMIEMDDETARLKKDFFEPRLSYGFLSMLAGEVGDTPTRDKLLAYSKDKYSPVWQDGMFHYPFDKKKQCSNLTGTLIAIAKANPKNGLWTMHNKPFDAAHFNDPMVDGVDFPKLTLRRAIYDKQRNALVITTEPGTDDHGSSSIKVVNLDPSKSWRLIVDGKVVEKYKDSREITIPVALDKRHNIVLVGE